MVMSLIFGLVFVLILLTFIIRFYRKLNNEEVGGNTSGCLASSSWLLVLFGMLMIETGGPLLTGGIICAIIFFVLAIIFSYSYIFVPSNKSKMKETESENETIPITFSIPTVHDEDKKRDEKKTIKNDEHPEVKRLAPSSVKMSRSQFDEIISCAHEIKDLITKIGSNKEIFDAVNENSQSVGGDEMPNRIYLVKVLKSIFMKDMRRCYKEMGHVFRFSIRTGEDQALVLISNILSNSKPNLDLEDYDKFSTFVRSGNESHFSSTRETFNNLMNDEVNFSVEGEDEFGLSALLQTCGGEAEDLEKYRILLYRLVSLIAKMDGKVTEKEKKWLERMLVINEMRPDGSNRNYVPEAPEAELEKLIGLNTVKKEVKALSNYISVQQKRKAVGLPVPEISYHCVFTGNPGTGKTTVARILAGIYRDKGILKKGHLIETDRSGLVAEYVGQTAVKTNRIIDKALDGVLFIDEAYSLIAQGEDFGQEAIATLLKRMEDDRDRLIVILAGYTKEMEDFINSNPGLRSRFNRYIFFPDYSVDELTEIFLLYASKHEYHLSETVKQAIKEKIGEAIKNNPQDFGNARFVRNFFEHVVQSQANRLAADTNVTREKLTEILSVDLV